MSSAPPRVRDYTDIEAPTGLSVEVDVGTAYEVVLALFAFGCEDRREYEVGSTWFEQTYADASPALQAGLDLFTAGGELLVGLLGTIHELPGPKSVDALTAHLEAMDPIDLRMLLLRCCAPGAGDAELRAAAAGDLARAEAVLQGPALSADTVGEQRAVKHRGAVAAILEPEPEEFRDLLVDTIRRYAAELLTEPSRLLAILERDAAEKRALAVTTEPEKLVEQATNGVTFARGREVSGVVLIPSVIVRPWVVIAEHGPLRLFAYPVTDDALSADPDAPPAWMVQFYKALGDERRLRIVGILAEGPVGLGDLAERMGLSKSTVHHHVSLLRQAGLVLVTVGADKEYSLRNEVVTQARAMLDAYLGSRGRTKT